MMLRVGKSLASNTDATTVIVIRAGGGDVSLKCGGVEMGDPKTLGDKQPIAADAALGTVLGKRYVDQADTVELLCTKGGEASLTLDGEPMTIKVAKPLPASD